MQEYFLDTYSDKESPKVELISNIKQIREGCKELGRYTAQPGGQTIEKPGLLRDFWSDSTTAGSYKMKIVDELTPYEDDICLTKWRYSAFKKIRTY